MSAQHATAVRLDGFGVLIRGPSGSGKTRLAMALLQHFDADTADMSLVTDSTRPTSSARPLNSHPTVLIGDDYLNLASAQAGLTASPANGLEGLLELRGLGILAMPWCTDVLIHLAIDLVSLEDMMRLPENTTSVLEGHTVSQLNVPMGDLAHQVLLVTMALRTLSSKG